MPSVAFNEVWNRIVANAGEVFRTKTGLDFTYEVRGDGFYPSRTNYRISKSDFILVFRKVPFEGPGAISNEVRGSAYV